eukprot:355141-Chlamydomonas_euryale.AAC.1
MCARAGIKLTLVVRGEVEVRRRHQHRHERPDSRRAVDRHQLARRGTAAYAAAAAVAAHRRQVAVERVRSV